MKRTVAFWTLLALGLALAQGGPPNLSPETRQRFEAYRPVFELVATIGLMEELDKQRDLSLTKAQAQRLLPILRDLQNRPDLKPAEAAKALSTIEDSILTPAQLKWMDETLLKRREEARQRQGQNPQAGSPQAPGGAAACSRPSLRAGPTTPSGSSPELRRA